jgi:hypothetical protein
LADGQVEQLEGRIAETEEEISRGGGVRYRDLLRTLQDYRNVVLSIRADFERAQGEREGFFKLLRELWAELRKLHESTTGTAMNGADPAPALGSLCAEVDRVVKEFEDRRRRVIDGA